MLRLQVMHDVRHISIWIARPPDEVYASDAPMGRVQIRFADPNSFGVLDHDVTLESGAVIHNVMRVVPNGDGSELTFMLMRQREMSPPEFEKDRATIESDLRTLKHLLERRT